MNRKALWYALAYSGLVILLKLTVLLGGYSLSTFGFYFANLTGALLILPFYVLAIGHVRRADYGGFISGRQALRVALTVFAVGALLTSVYHYAEYKVRGPELAEAYYRSDRFLEFLKRTPVKPEQYEEKIQEQLRASEDAAFKATTGKLFALMIVGLGGAFVCSALMKRAQPRSPQPQRDAEIQP